MTSCPTSAPCSTGSEAVAAGLTTRYGYRPIETPLFEQAAVFERGIGAVTDVVEKELFRIAPRSEEAEAWALRPEPTAGIVRAYIQHGMQTLPQPVKLTTTGPMFRYDRPQAGRYRQFWQFDVEAIGDPGPAVDAEVIELGTRFYAEAGVTGVEVLVNSIGDPAAGRPTSPSWSRTTAATPRRSRRPSATAWSATRCGCSTPRTRRWRSSTRPRRGSRTACARRARRTSRASKAHLAALGVPHRVEPGLVRGLDYYTRTAFEFYVAGREGQQQALGGGGRYDGLVELLGGKPTPGDRVRPRARPRRARARGAGAPPRRGGGPARRRRRRGSRRHGRRGCGSRPACGPRACASAPTWRAASSAASSRPRAGTAPTSRSSSATSSRTGTCRCGTLLAGTQRVVGIADLARELARAGAGHRHG